MVSKKININFWGWWTIGIVVITVVISLMQTRMTHYVGETLITTEQYENLYDDIDLSREKNYITPTEGGNLFTYNFYGLNEYEYLTSKPYTFTDSLLFITIRKLAADKLFLILAILFIVLWYMMNYKNGLLHRWYTKINHYFQKIADKKIPLMENHKLVISPDAIKVGEEKGIIAVRSWDVDEKGVLKSLAQSTRWSESAATADKNPHKNNPNGIYGYRLGAFPKQSGKVMGIVTLDGEYSYHPDGVIRAEHCKVLGFLISKGFERTARFISNKYNVPTFLDESALAAYYNWLFSEQGQKALQHNYELLKEK